MPWSRLLTCGGGLSSLPSLRGPPKSLFAVVGSKARPTLHIPATAFSSQRDHWCDSNNLHPSARWFASFEDRSEERRVGKECRSRCWAYNDKIERKNQV